MKVTILGVTYESIDTSLKHQLDGYCFDCDIYKSNPPQFWHQYPICCLKEYEYVNQSCCNRLEKGVHRIFKQVKDENRD